MNLLMETSEDTKVRELVRADRCDSCGAQALTQVYKDDLMLLFCGHHGRRYEPTLIGNGWEVHFTSIDEGNDYE